MLGCVGVCVGHVWVWVCVGGVGGCVLGYGGCVLRCIGVGGYWGVSGVYGCVGVCVCLRETDRAVFFFFKDLIHIIAETGQFEIYAQVSTLRTQERVDVTDQV